eukprot:gene27837-34617_t
MQDDYGNALPGAKTISERLAALGDGMAGVSASLAAGDARMTRIEDNAAQLRSDLAENTKATREVVENTKDIVRLAQAIEGLQQLIERIARWARPLAAIAAMWPVNEIVKKRLLAAAVALSAGAGGIATQYATQAPQPSPGVVLAMEIGAHYESSGRHIGKPYVDKFGKGQPWTVCNGVTGKGVDPGRYYSPDDCKRLERPKYQEAERAARALFVYWETYNVWVQASILDMIYNLGAEALQGTKLQRLANAGDLEGMCMQMPLWVKGTVDGRKVTLAVLVDRRDTTRELCAEWGRTGHFSAGLLARAQGDAPVAANAALGWAYLGQRDDTIKARADMGAMERQRDGARGAASACSDAVEALQDQAAKRAAAAVPMRAAAVKAAQQSERRADYTLTLKPRHVGDACASAQALADEWLQGRAKP